MLMAMLAAMQAMMDEARTDEEHADLCADEAFQAERLGDRSTAAILRDLAVRHRVQAIQSKARVEARRHRLKM